MTTGRDITDALVMGVKQALYECSGGDFEATDREARAIAERLRDEFADALRAEVARERGARQDAQRRVEALQGENVALHSRVQIAEAEVARLTDDRDGWQERATLYLALCREAQDAASVAQREAEALRERAEKAEAEAAALQSSRCDLALLIGRLIRRMRVARSGRSIEAGDEALAQAAIGYLHRNGLTPSPLRDDAARAREADRG